MEFEDEDHDSDQEEEQEQSIPITTPPPPLPFSASPTPRRPTGAAVRYRECLKNHAVSIGGHAVDGCGEFMAAGEDGTLDALRCAACNCHRNFHRRDTDGNPAATPHRPTLYPHFYRPPAPPGYLHVSPTGVHPGGHVYQHRPPPPLALPSTSGGAHSREEMDDVSNPGSSGGGGTGKKRSRTKFTAEQKEKMAEFAERLGWRIQKHDEEAVQRFCAEVHVHRHVLKVWMHNNKNTLGKKPS